MDRQSTATGPQNVHKMQSGGRACVLDTHADRFTQDFPHEQRCKDTRCHTMRTNLFVSAGSIFHVDMNGSLFLVRRLDHFRLSKQSERREGRFGIFISKSSRSYKTREDIPWRPFALWWAQRIGGWNCLEGPIR
jgi:hypothetical protein